MKNKIKIKNFEKIQKVKKKIFLLECLWGVNILIDYDDIFGITC